MDSMVPRARVPVSSRVPAMASRISSRLWVRETA